jgi:L-threonylcarbamoyladenylate synthase
MIISISKAIELLKLGKTVAIPTETVYGLAASAFQLSSIESIYEIKGRPGDNPLIVHIANEEQLLLLTDSISNDARTLIQSFWPGPLTLIFPKKESILDKITGGLPNVAVRMPSHEIAIQILKETGPLVAPSANKSGSPSPTRTEHVLADYHGLVPVVDGGKCEVGIESTVLSLVEEPYTILRPGKISKFEIEEVLGKQIQLIAHNQHHEKVMSPGMKYTHYAPKASVRWMNAMELEGEYEINTLYLHVHGGFNGQNHKGYKQDFVFFTQELFDQFRKADELGYKHIAIEPFTEETHTLAPALLNRILKAIGK